MGTVAAICVHKSTRAAVVLLCALTLAACAKYYYGKPGAPSSAFREDSEACIREVGIPSGSGQYALVTRETFQPCMEKRGWVRAKKVDPGYDWYRGIERDDVVSMSGGAPQPAAGDGTGTLSREIFCRRTHFDGRSDGRDRIAEYRKCLAQ